PKGGCILIEGTDICTAGLKDLALKLGYVPQSAPSTFPLTVFDTVLLGRRPHVNWRIREIDKDIAFDIMKLMKLDHLALRLFNELSGGEKQKVLIARAICQEPSVLVLDEPTSNLDLRHQLDVLDLISGFVRERGLAAVMAMHDLNLASRYSTMISMLKNGRIYAAGEPSSVLTPENIREVYGVDTVIHFNSGSPYIIPVSPVKESVP
ncbi:MAG: ABC transporter ATP-binding protein, partial [Dehalococcoidales bacterium]|nr:ABC transporter ATP-binding protein [Dehalococcoidales bacterium]